ncbi:M-phase phosphoprotein 8 [Hyperolius riggenbachi]|uniref:M-phase phosphoprotein 8 n=1 Tax=Hyperolius riggenbachi TaxID=752182 RepID=UPI0035A33523
MAESAGRDGNGAAAGGSGGVEEDRGESGALMETGESGDDEEDVFEVESIIDSKIEEGQVLYRVRWKNYESDADTWEPEGHLDTCREVLLEFRRKQAEAKQKAAKKETPPRLSSSDLFEAESDSDVQEEIPQKKKKKKSKEEDEEQMDEMKKKKSKSGKSREKSKIETEPSESQPPESKPKKRSSEHKEDLSSKKPKKEDKDSKKSKKEEGKDAKAKGKEEVKEKKSKKPSGSETPRKGESSPLGPDTETFSVCSDVISDEKDKAAQEVEVKIQETTPPHAAEEPAFAGPDDEEMDDVKLKKKKKKHKKKHEDSKASLVAESQQDTKKSQMKKQKMVEKLKEAFTDKLPSPVQKSPRPSTDDKIRKSVDFLPEVNVSAKPVQPKEAKKAEIAKERPKKRHEPEKEGKKEPIVKKTLIEQKPAHDAFTVSAEDREECMESTKKERPPPDNRLPEDHKMKVAKPVLKERRSTQDETDSWTFGALEGEQEVMDSVCRMQENSGPLESRNQVSAMTMDLQLEWMTLEDFQRHLDGADEIIPKDPISSSALKEAVKNGDYLTVKYALNSDEEYNLDQEDSSGMTLVMMAAAVGQDDILRILIKKGAKVNARQKNGTTALMHAAEKNYLTTVAILLDAGAFVNVQQVTGETALMKACKRGNYDIARLLMEQGADCNVLSKHQGNALQFAKQSNVVLLFELINGHLEKLSRVVEDAIKDYFEARLVVLEAVFPIACHRLCEGPDFSLDFNYKPPHNTPADSGILLFVFHANFVGKEVVVRLCGSCSVQAVVLNDKFQLPVFLDAHFIYSFSPVAGANKLFIRLSEVPTAKVKLLISAYRVQLH